MRRREARRAEGCLVSQGDYIVYTHSTEAGNSIPLAARSGKQCVGAARLGSGVGGEKRNLRTGVYKEIRSRSAVSDNEVNSAYDLC